MANGRIFCCSAFDLNKKWFFYRLTILKRIKEDTNGHVKVCTSSWVSRLSPLGSKSLKKALKCVGPFSRYSGSADVCPVSLGEKRNFFKTIRRKKPVLTTSKASLGHEPGLRSGLWARERLLTVSISISITFFEMIRKKKPCLTIFKASLGLEPGLRSGVMAQGRHETVPATLSDKKKPDLTSEPYLTTYVSLAVTRNDPPKESINEHKSRSYPLSSTRPYLFNRTEVTMYPKSKPLIKTLYDCKNKGLMNQKNTPNENQKSSSTKACKITNQYNVLPVLYLNLQVDDRKRIEGRLMRSGDIESNPGPGGLGKEEGQKRRPPANLMVTSYNVRGLNDEAKLRHLINCLYKDCGGKNTDFVACLQETYLERDGKLPYLWRGNFYLTPGTGSSCGCITLLSSHISVIESHNIDNRGHVLVCQKAGESGAMFLIANIYAPNPNSNEKIEFFERAFEILRELKERFNSKRCIVAGDFNLNFGEEEMKNRNYSTQEKRIARIVKELGSDFEVNDCWKDGHSFTWRRPNSEIFSTIDRILYSKESLILKECRANWSLSFSDHASVEAAFVYFNEEPIPRSRIVRLDPTLAKDGKASVDIINGVAEMMQEVPDSWNPHNKLEFLKVCIRTVVEKVQAERKKVELTEEEMLNEELDVAIKELAGGIATFRQQSLIEYIEELRVKKSLLIEKKGKRLAERLGTRWYNEGEKSTRYFMRLLNRANPDKFVRVENSEGELIVEKGKVEEEIVKFYKDLYEDFDTTKITQDDNEFFQEIEQISGQEDLELASDVTEEELRKTLLECVDSAPGPDGIPYSIIGLLWATYGPILTAAWRHSLISGTLAPSHKVSYLKLIPKAGKNLEKLTNWRPISLSNCDHKIITKTYARRMSEKLKSKLGGGQTAYLKGRLINDNLRAILCTMEIAKLEEVEGLIVALDAKKAFDSVSHDYIEMCLRNFGCSSFIPIFRTLYKDLETDILINGKIVKGFKVRRGVKQGDALSCILFIICMEPLLRNIERNRNIRPLRSTVLSTDLPKTYSYADDVSCTISSDGGSLRALFREYERLTRMSGLELNADKTELMLMRDGAERSYNVEYLNRSYDVSTSESIKLNGLILHRDKDEMRTQNVKSATEKMDAHFKKWARRNLSTLGRILIAKSFGISQIIYLMQTIDLKANDYKMINAILYKFIWNRHYMAAKAPERVKREIVNKPVKFGGYGMLDVIKLDESLKIKALGRFLGTNHPFLRIIKSKLDVSNFFEPRCDLTLDGMLNKGIELLKRDRERLWESEELNSNKIFMRVIRDLRIRDVLNREGRISLAYFMMGRRAQTVGDLNLGQLAQLERFIKNTMIEKLRLAITINDRGPADETLLESYYVGTKFKLLSSCASKEIRTQRSDKDPIMNFKIGYDLSRRESLSWGHRLSKLTSIRHRFTLLRVAHGDVYTKDKLKRYGLIDENICPRCDEVEDLDHKIRSCAYVKRIWLATCELLKEAPNQNSMTMIMGTKLDQTLTSLTVKAEILSWILRLKDSQTYLVHPKHLVRMALRGLARKETKKEILSDIKDILSENEPG